MRIVRMLCRALFSLAPLALWHAGAQVPTSKVKAPAVNPSRIYGQLPLGFEANRGQMDPHAQFLSRGPGYSVFLTSGGMTLALRPSGIQSQTTVATSPSVPTADRSALAVPPWQFTPWKRTSKPAPVTLTISLVGATSNPTVVGEQPLPTKVNYFIGRDPHTWKTNVPTYARVRYRNVYPGIDLIYYGNNRQVEYDFVVAPGADPNRIQLAVKGADALTIDSKGNLAVTKTGSRLLFQAPGIYQEVRGNRVQISGGYSLKDSTHVGFAVAPHDRTKPLVIDPVLVYSTFLGGSGDDEGVAVAVDVAGNAYVTGTTDSPNFPLAVLGSFSPTQTRSFVAKLDASGSNLLFADYFGGSVADWPTGIALDSSGNAYITGNTDSPDFPVVNPYQANIAGSQDAFVTKFSADGSSLLYSTYLGGTNTQFAWGIAVDSSTSPVVAGVTYSPDFPLVNPYQSSGSTNHNGFGFVTKFSPDGQSLVYSTYLGGTTVAGNVYNPASQINGIAVDVNGNAYVTGSTDSNNFPVTGGAYLTTYPSNAPNWIGFVSKFTGSGSLAYSTYLGGTGFSFMTAVAVDGSGSAYVTGYDEGNDNFPITSTSLCNPSTENCAGVTATKLDPAGSSLVYSTYLGANDDMSGTGIQVDVSGDAFIVGSSHNNQFPSLSNPIEGYSGAGDVGVVELDPTGSSLLFSSFLGGSQGDVGLGVALDSNGDVYLTGITSSSDFPVTQTAFQTTLGGGEDVFVSKIGMTNAPGFAAESYFLQFPAQEVGAASSPTSTILRNMGTAPLSINTKTLTGDFSETDDCGTNVAPASYCTLNVTFTPTLTGARSGTILLSDNAAGSPHTIQLMGNGLATTTATINPSTVTFAPSLVNTTSQSQTVTVTNTGNGTLFINSIQVSGDFAVGSSNCGPVAPGGSCTVLVTFTPTSSGARTGSLSFIDSAGDGSQNVALGGSGIDFGFSATNSSATVTSGGTATYELSVTSLGGNFSSAVGLTCGDVPSLAACTISPSSVVPGAGSSIVTVSVTTTGPNAQLVAPRKAQTVVIAWSLGQGLGIFGLLLLGKADRKKRRWCYRTGVMLIATVLLTGCGSASAPSQSSSASNATPKGTYTLRVVGSSGATEHVATLTLTVR